MKKLFLLILLLLIVSFLGYYFFSDREKRPSPLSPALKTSKTTRTDDVPAVTVIAENLDTPWALAFLPDGSLLVTERPGRVRLIEKDGNLQLDPIATIADVVEIGEGGLLGVTVHPDFLLNRFVYLYYTYQTQGNQTLNKVVRYKLTKDNKLTEETVIIDRIPGAPNHNGGRIKFGPDKLLYITTGDAQEPSQAQDTKTLGGKILRVTDDGKIPSGNPFDNPVYSYGHRNVQGLSWNTNNDLWATEHGRSGAASGFDELNLIEASKNYGWPEIQGGETRAGMETPRRHSGPTTTWAPSGATFTDNALFFAGLRGQTLYEATIENNTVTNMKEHLKGEYGRLRDVIVGEDNMLYVTTSNRDGRGNPADDDDRILRINPSKL